MIIRKERIRSLPVNLPGIEPGTRVVLGLAASESVRRVLVRVGFPDPAQPGEAVLPPANGPVATRNAEGFEIVHRDRPKETAYRQSEWHWEEFRGRYGRERKSRIVDIPYERYPRTFVPPASLELTLVDHPERGLLVVTSKTFIVDFDAPDPLLHGINLLLEVFGECQVFSKDLDALDPPEVRRLNWDILPPGRHPWGEVEAKVQDVLDEKGEGARRVFRHRWERINAHGPAFVAVGRAGFRGYLVFGFPEQELFVLESAFYGNATYVLGEGWEQLSRLTKAQLLDADLHRGRIIHREGWDRAIDQLLDAGNE